MQNTLHNRMQDLLEEYRKKILFSYLRGEKNSLEDLIKRVEAGEPVEKEALESFFQEKSRKHRRLIQALFGRKSGAFFV